jgi:predicted nucleic acid-binding protein
MRIYLDSCLIIYRTEGDAALRNKINRRLLNLPQDPLTVVYTDLVRLECRVKPIAAGNGPLLAQYDDFFATPGFSKLNLDGAVFDLATELRAEYRLKTPDALHLAAAIRADCSEFWSNDQRLGQAAHRRVTLISINQL